MKNAKDCTETCEATMIATGMYERFSSQQNCKSEPCHGHNEVMGIWGKCILREICGTGPGFWFFRCKGDHRRIEEVLDIEAEDCSLVLEYLVESLLVRDLASILNPNSKMSSTGAVVVGVCKVATILILLLHPAVPQQNQNNLADNLWREVRQAVKKPEDPGTLYGNERHCKSPEPEQLEQAHDEEDETWSIFFSRYTLDAGDELDVWLTNQETFPATQNEKHEGDAQSDILIQTLFPVLFVICLFLSTFMIPYVGALIFHVLWIIWSITTHPEVKRVGRRALIIHEKLMRQRARMLLPENVRKLPKSTFVLPSFFRLDSDEEIPTELQESDENDDEWLCEIDMETELVEEKEAGVHEAESIWSGLEIDEIHMSDVRLEELNPEPEPEPEKDEEDEAEDKEEEFNEIYETVDVDTDLKNNYEELIHQHHFNI